MKSRKNISNNIKKENNNTLPKKSYLEPEEKGDTTAVRISVEYYEKLREQAFKQKTSIRQLLDEILENSLN